MYLTCAHVRERGGSYRLFWGSTHADARGRAALYVLNSAESLTEPSRPFIESFSSHHVPRHKHEVVGWFNATFSVGVAPGAPLPTPPAEEPDVPLNVGEAHDVNRLLDWLLGLNSPSGRPVPAGDAMESAARLADKASKTLMAGLDGNQVLKLWRQRAPKPLKKKGPKS